MFAALYLAIVILCIAGTLSADGNDKGRFVLLQLPLAPQKLVRAAFRPIASQR